MQKLKHYGFSESLCSLMANYLSDRSFVVHLNDLNEARSEKSCIAIGVLWGSILGPLLFILYINEPCFIQLRSILALFVDETMVYFCADSSTSVASVVSNDIHKICFWFDHNRLVVNWSRTNAMIFSRHSPSIVPLNINLGIQENHITCGGYGTFKFIGVTLDRELNLDQHVSNVYKIKVNQRCAIIFRNAYLFSLK